MNFLLKFFRDLIGMKDKPKDKYPAGWEQICQEEKERARAWYVRKHGHEPKTPLCDVVMVNKDLDDLYGRITYYKPRYLIEIWRDAPRRETLYHEFKHGYMMLNKGLGTEGSIVKLGQIPDASRIGLADPISLALIFAGGLLLGSVFGHGVVTRSVVVNITDSPGACVKDLKVEVSGTGGVSIPVGELK